MKMFSLASFQRATRQAGMTLIELIIATMLGLFVIVGTLGIFISNREASRANENLARLQENARTAFDMMGHSIREAGAVPCFRTHDKDGAFMPKPAGSGPIISEFTIPGIQLPSPLTDIRFPRDAVYVFPDRPPADLGSVGASVESNSIMLIHGTESAIWATTTASSITAGASLPNGLHVFCNQLNGAVFSGAGSNFNPASLGISTDDKGGWLSDLVVEVWYVGADDKKLYRTIISPNAGDRVTEEVISGVSKMEIHYLCRKSKEYDKMDKIDSGGNPINCANKWLDVTAIEISLSLEGANEIVPGKTPENRKITRTLRHVASVRNRLP